ncbi:MAG: ACT domain-containing protein [Desulforegulaceae bacterium]|nr:ACT domain-containing protein [Desulforegulaceae bacterium]
MKKAIITSLTDDRPGVLASISASLFKCDCNLLEVSQTILGSEFAGIFIVSMPKELNEEELKKKLETDLRGENINIHVKPLKESKTFETPCDPFIVTTFGPDRKGLVSAVTSAIARHNSNVTNLKAFFHGGDNPRDNVMIYEIDIPKSENLKALSEDLNKLGEKFSLEINIQHKKIFDNITKI